MPEQGGGKPDGEFSCLVTIVQNWVDLHNVQDFHQQVRFTIGETTGNGCSFAWRIGRIQAVHVQAYVYAGDMTQLGQGLFGHSGQAHFIDVANGEEVHDAAGQMNTFLGIKIAQPYLDDIDRGEFLSWVADVDQRPVTIAGEDGHGHAVDVAGRGGGRRVEVGMSIDPDKAQLFAG
ncbi:MAG: hypothetical protein PVH65_12915 [Chloroflexota bacterium]